MQNHYLINGKADACLTPFDRGFTYGDGVFRTMEARHGVPSLWSRQYRKLSDDCNALGIVCPGEDLLRADIARLCGDRERVAVKIVVTRGEGARGYAVPPLAQPNRVVIMSPMPDYPEQHYSEGVRLHLCRMRLAPQPRLAGIKHLNRLENVLARMEWIDPQIADGLLLDMEGRVIECTMSNIFLRTGGRLLTPDLSQCGVSGVTRERIIELAPALGYAVATVSIGLQDLRQADEVIVCNSLFGAWQVRSLDGDIWPLGTLAGRLRELLMN